MITAKVQCTSKISNPAAGNDAVTLSFAPDYADGRNQEWAVATPALSLSMSVRADVANQFEPGARYTLQFVTDEEGS